MRRLPRLLVAANGGWAMSFALMVNEQFARPAHIGNQTRQHSFVVFRIIFNVLKRTGRAGPPLSPHITPAFPQHIKFYSNSAQMRGFF